ncbi:MAG: nucleoside-diphosphate kinase [Rhabdochlamydiaceae bacterium]|nr:nucleoside-diphosphate kinase [Rhabdochlamydiaceae bacterium]
MRKFIALCLGACVSLFSSVEAQEKTSQPAVQQTLSILKPDAVEANEIGAIIAVIERSGLQVVALKMLQLTPEQAKQFYSVHKDRPFYNDLVAYMSSGPVVVQVLEGKDAVQAYRTLMGATDPKKASPGTLRALFGKSLEKNAVHGSDSLENAKTEVAFFFTEDEIYPGK